MRISDWSSDVCSSDLIDYAWGGTLSITMKRLPAFGRLDGDVFYGMGFSGQGVALTTLAGMVFAEAVAGQAERLGALADVPTPHFLGGTVPPLPDLDVSTPYYAFRAQLYHPSSPGAPSTQSRTEEHWLGK